MAQRSSNWGYQVLLAIAIIAGVGLKAQSVQTVINRNSILIGERIQYTIKGTFPGGGNTISWFNVPDSIPHFDILDKGKLEQVTFKDGSRGYEQTMLITSFDSGRWNLPTFVVRSKAPGQQQPMTFYTDSFPINVLYSPSDSTEDLRDIKPVREVTVIDNSWYYIAGGILLLLILAYFIWRYLRKRPKVKDEGPVSKLSPYEEAMHELKQLEEQPLRDPVSVKAYHTKLTDIFKRYLGRVQKKNLQNRTTGDLLVMITDHSFTVNDTATLAAALRLSDAVKFAKYLPPEPESRGSVNGIRSAITAVQQSLNPKAT